MSSFTAVAMSDSYITSTMVCHGALPLGGHLGVDGHCLHELLPRKSATSTSQKRWIKLRGATHLGAFRDYQNHEKQRQKEENDA